MQHSSDQTEKLLETVNVWLRYRRLNHKPLNKESNNTIHHPNLDTFEDKKGTINNLLCLPA